jgi:hypothetical protein
MSALISPMRSPAKAGVQPTKVTREARARSCAHFGGSWAPAFAGERIWQENHA